MCNQTVCLIAAELERRGITTVCLAFVRHVVEKVRPPRALIVPFAHGYPLDVPKDAARQRRVLARALALAERAGAMPPLIEEY
jgi:hypothetical protein